MERCRGGEFSVWDRGAGDLRLEAEVGRALRARLVEALRIQFCAEATSEMSPLPRLEVEALRLQISTQAI